MSHSNTANVNSKQALTTEDRAAIANLQWMARAAVEGMTGGRHRSPHMGTSAEFKEHRPYVRGDESRHIDWKQFGKTDRLFVRQYEDETNLHTMLLVDQSGSMAYTGSRSGGTSKHQFAVGLAACLASLLIGQQDAVGLATFDIKLQRFIPPRAQTKHLQHLFEALVRSRPDAETHLADVLRTAAGQLKRRGLLVLLSDCFDSVEAFVDSIKFFRHHGHEVVIFQIWDQDELDFPFSQRTEFQSLERADHRRLVEPNTLRRNYLEQLSQFQSQLRNGLAKLHVDLVECNTEQSHSEVLAAYVRRRSQASVSGGARR